MHKGGINMSNLWKRAKALGPEFAKVRQNIHQHPELGMEEVRTSGIVAEYLRGLGLEVTAHVANTGVVGLLCGGQPGKTIALRADMDALTIPERSGVPFASLEPGKMHACGHDGHTAILMGVAKLLTEMKAEIHGNVKFLFQPAEEALPGGAAPMIEAGVLENPHVDAAMGLHLSTDIPTGQIGLMAGASCAAADMIQIKISGKGGHGAHPHKSIDAIAAAGYVIVALQTIASREIDPLGSVVVTLGTINGGYRNNVIADQVLITGTVRTLDPVVRASMPERIERILSGVCEALRCGHELTYEHGYPSIVNDPQMADLVELAAQKLLGIGNVLRLPVPSMGGEDFSYFAAKVPAIYFRLGGGNVEKGCIYPGHHPQFNFDEDAIPVGMAVTVAAVLEFLNK